MIHILADEHIPFLKGALEPFARVEYVAGGSVTRKQASGADGLIIRTRTLCDRNLLEGTNIRFIATATIGFDHIDTAYCAAHGISWHYAPGCNAASVRQYVAGVLAHLLPDQHYKPEQMRLGIIGVGHVGSMIAELAGIFGFSTLLNDPPRAKAEGPSGFSSLEEIWATCDIISLHVPLTHNGPFPTHYLAGPDFFSHLKKKPILINTSRGGVVDAFSVKAALRSGVISSYCSDVWEHEPDIDPELLSLTRIATPHIAGYSAEGKANGTAACVRAASRHFGLGIDDWYPAHIPPPDDPVIRIHTSGKSEEAILFESVLRCYDVLEDDRALRNNPGNFERLRNFYRVRREFPAFTVQLAPDLPGLHGRLNQLGFSVTY